MNIEKIFEKQNNPVTDKNVLKLKSKTLYNNKYKIGDKFYYFMIQSTDENYKFPWDERKFPALKINLETIVNNELEKFNTEYKFLRFAQDIPVFEKK